MKELTKDGHKVNLAEKFASFSEQWTPKVVGELNGQWVKLAKVEGDFVWHDHAHEDELFLVIAGKLTIHLRDRSVELEAGEFFIVPAGVEHRPEASEEAQILLFEPKSTAHTGVVESERTVTPDRQEWI